MAAGRVLLATGVTGSELGVLVDHLSRGLGVEAYKFEQLVEEEFKAPIFYAIELLMVDRRRVLDKFRRVFEYLAGEVSRTDAAIIALHLTYHRRRHIVPNPVLAWLRELGARLSVVYYVEDYYHALVRVAERVARGATPSVAGGQMLDPLGLLYWRAADQSILSLLEARGVETYVMGNKHPGETHLRLAAHLLGREYGGVERFRTAYVSHPITLVKKRAASEGAPINTYPDALEIEGFKERLTRSCRDLIVFSPTSIDELILDGKGELKRIIRAEDRWPYPRTVVHKDYRFPVNLEDEVFDRFLYPVRETVRSRGYMRVVKGLIEAQIESRDLSYVTQSDMVIAYRPTMYKTLHQGVETEIRTATAQAKPVYAVIPAEEAELDYKLFRFWYQLGGVDELLHALHC
ncbi:MAG: hypothetical protein GXO09_05665 [Crenarchaeota archaeon]|nr:hypothetical protein [Thermoproteota archaeon]